MSRFEIKGWCPDAWHPMASGDGLLVRVKPRLARLTRKQVLALCSLSHRFGNGIVDLSRRANLQIRGVHETDAQKLLGELIAEGLVDADPVREMKRNQTVAPDWVAGDDTHRIACDLLARLELLPDLPGKIGIVIDAGAAPILLNDPGDFRIERGVAGDLILRPAGRETGVNLAVGNEADMLIAIAHWFVESGGREAGRMTRHLARLPDWATGSVPPAAPRPAIAPGQVSLGFAYGIPFGQIEADALAATMADPAINGLRVTPWRSLMIEGTPRVAPAGLIADPADPLLRVDACPGAPFCPQASVGTRDLARRLASVVPGRLHVSGCTKSCAREQPADVIITGRAGRFDLAFNACAGAPAERPGLEPAQVLAHFGAA